MSISDDLKRGIALTPLEVAVFENEYIRKVQEYPFALRCGEYLRTVFDRMRKIEQNCGVRRPGHIVLLRIALDLDESSFYKILASSYLWLDTVNFRQAGAPVIDRFFIAMKLLIGVPDTVVIEEEVRRGLTLTKLWHCRVCGYEWKSKGKGLCPMCGINDAKNLPMGEEQRSQIEMAAKKRVQRAKKELVPVLFAYLIRGFVMELMGRALPANPSYWVRVN